ncbi:DNA replication ATP-dependent helicase/nuclease JHS1-like isoform X2 [Hevea brasiliensis]|uniref:DNA replication ATP-dependent helicase/nuclease JHS1-like isoform X2 n=1 Tax=Hevea brasiliensis TaxID=3981 RepID=UPI0025F561A1|nr:DNA replication ATP-dependent helicase/nuclease JHS1-like isoform X2 [Hevea brasiliensis]
MGPRKKLKYSTPATKKSNSNQQRSQQPAKHGIQHFFHRHTQNALLASQSCTSSHSQLTHSASPSVALAHNPPVAPNIPKQAPHHSSTLNPCNAANQALHDPANGNAPNSAASAFPVPKAPITSLPIHPNITNGSNGWIFDAENASQAFLSQNLTSNDMDAADSPADISPEISKSVSLDLQRFKFSPGMLIKQSQDDGGDEITWRISPVNERLQAVSKHMPEVAKLSTDSLKINSLSMRPCSLNQISHIAGKIDKRFSSPRREATETTILPANRENLERVNPFQDMAIHVSMSEVNGSLATRQSPFRTPPSLSYCHERAANDVQCNELSDQLILRQHKKALLELLDQVEDVISVEDSVLIGNKAYSSTVQHVNGKEMPPKSNPLVQREAPGPQEKLTRSTSNHKFLILEVSEKHRPGDPFGAYCPYKVLRLLNEQGGEERLVYLHGEWFHSVIAPGDTVNVIGEFDDQGKCKVDHDHNLLIVHPDILLSGTRVAASFSCPRRSVLDERLKCCEHSDAALIGTLLHQIFQAGLMDEKPTVKFLERYARVVLQKNIDSLYACGVNEHDMLKTLVEAIPKILNWIIAFKGSQDSKVPVVDFGSDYGLRNLKISEVIDIEEMAWAPKYGLKGIIDASIRVKVESSGNEANEKILPLEFKTGKVPNGQSSLEHCAQVILYTLLMSERYLRHIDSGILHYLYSDQTQGIMVRRSDVVGLIMRRNELASDILKASKMQQLPPMLRSPSMCRNCHHLAVCTIYHKVHGGSTESSGLGDVFDSHVYHLTAAHCAFLQQWDRLIDLEAKETQLVRSEIWHSNAMKSDRSTNCLSSIVLDASNGFSQQKSLKDNRFIYRFVPRILLPHNVYASKGDSLDAPSPPVNDLDCTLKIGDYVILSTESGHQTVASGVIADIGQFHVSVSLSKRLRLPSSNSLPEANDLLQEVWRIDKDETMTSFSVMRSNLVQLFLQNAQSSHLRNIIVDLEPPRFDSGCVFSQDPAISYIWSVKSLNGDQRRAILKILTAKDYALILGMPGTGKTSTMVYAVKALLMRCASILLTSYTNSAVDNLLIKLKAQGIDFLRIGRHEAVHEEVRANCFSAMDVQSVEEIRLRFNQVKVVAVTCLGITSPLLANKKFDVCIMDEAGQITLPISLGPLMFASKFVLVGDHYQLPPLVQSTEARENGMGISLFCRLSEAHPQAISALQSQYRMCQGIMELSNALIYGDRLRCGSPEIANRKLKFSRLKSCSSWLNEVLNPHKPIVFINTDMLPAHESKDSKTVNNPVEAYIIAEVAKELIKCGIESEDIGIITPYNSQANLIRTAVCIISVEINTIDKYQGRDKDCILVSFVRSSENPRNYSSSLLGDWHRINVALTRAKKKLILVGSCKTLSNVPLLKLLIDKVNEQSGILNVSHEDIKLEEHNVEQVGCC